MSTLLNPATSFYLLLITLATNSPLFSGPALSTLSFRVCHGNYTSCVVLCDITTTLVDCLQQLIEPFDNFLPLVIVVNISPVYIHLCWLPASYSHYGPS